MPDNENITEQNEAKVAEAMDAFAEDDSLDEKKAGETDDAKAGAKDEAAVDDDGQGDKEGDEGGGDDTGEADASKDSEKKVTPTQERMNKRLETVADDDDSGEKPVVKPVEPEPKPEQKAAGSQPGAFTKEGIVKTLSLISDKDLPESMKLDDDTTVDLKGYAKDFPEDFMVVKIIAGDIASKIVNQMLESGEIVKAKDMQALSGTVAQMSFDTALAQKRTDTGELKHPDYFSIVYGEGKKDFVAWVETQPAKIQKLASSLNQDDGDLILDFYKEATAKKRTAEFDKKAKEKKDEFDSIHKSSKNKRSNITAPSNRRGGEIDEAEAAFNEAD